MPELPAVAPGASHSGGFRHLDELLLGVGVDLTSGRCDLVNQGAWDREPLLAGILDGYVRDEVGFVADNDVKVEVRIAGCVLFVGWACGLPIASFCHGISFGSLGFVWEAFGPPGLQIAIESSAYEVWPQACNSPSQGGNFEGMRLLLGVAYVQPHNRTQSFRGERE